MLGDDRKRIVLASKFGMPMDDAGIMKGGSRRYILAAVEDSLRRLRTDWLDLYQIHQPDPLTPIEETLRALDDLVRSGKVRYIGCSNLPAWQVVEAQWTARQLGLNAFVSCQDEYSLLVRKHVEAELMPAMQAYGLGLLPFFPLASGLLTGKFSRNATMPAGARLTKLPRLAERFITEQNWPIVERLHEFAQARGHTLLELAFSWLLARKPVASVIAGATGPEQVAQNARAGDWQLPSRRRPRSTGLRASPQPGRANSMKPPPYHRSSYMIGQADHPRLLAARTSSGWLTSVLGSAILDNAQGCLWIGSTQ